MLAKSLAVAMVATCLTHLTAAVPGDWQSQIFYKYFRCCVDAQLGCPEMCEYPPPSPGIVEKICLSEAWSEYLNCYTQNKDNTQCCGANGVSGYYAICIDMCHGGHQPGESVGIEHAKCADLNEAISRCNHDNVTRSIKGNLWHRGG